MAELHEQFKRAAKARCDCIDEITESPSQRALKVGAGYNNIADNFTNWDIICYSIFYLAAQLSVIPELEKDIQSLAFKLHEAHYFKGGEFGLYDEDSIVELTKQRLKENNTAAISE